MTVEQLKPSPARIEIAEGGIVRVVRSVIYAPGMIGDSIPAKEAPLLFSKAGLPEATKRMIEILLEYGGAKTVEGLGTFFLFDEVKRDPNKFKFLTEKIAERFLSGGVNTILTAAESGVLIAEEITHICRRERPEVKLLVAPKLKEQPEPPYLEIAAYTPDQPPRWTTLPLGELRDLAERLGTLKIGFGDDIVDTLATYLGLKVLLEIASRRLKISASIAGVGSLAIKSYTGCLDFLGVEIPIDFIPCIDDLKPPNESCRTGAVKFRQLPEAVAFVH